jgi:flagellar biosynthesis protein FlhF
MKIKRFVAPDMRTAFALVRQEHGPDAVILSNRMTDDGVEIVAASNYDEALVHRTLDAMRPAEPAAPPAPSFARPAASQRDSQSRADDLHRPAVRNEPARQQEPMSPAQAAAAYFQRNTTNNKPAMDDAPINSAPASHKPNNTKPAILAAAEKSANDIPTAFELLAQLKPQGAKKPAAPAEDLDALPAFLRESLRSDRKPADARDGESLYAGIPAPEPLGFAEEDDFVLPASEPAKFGITPDSFAARLAASLPSAPANAVSRAVATVTADDVAKAEAIVASAGPHPSLPPRAGEGAKATAADVTSVASTGAASTSAAQPVAQPAVALVADNDPQRARENDEQLAAMRAELASMRGMIEEEMHRLTDERLKGSPVRSQAMELLEDYGFDAGITRDVALQIPADTELHRGRGLMLGLLSKKLPIMAEDPLLTGGVIALVGPTGAGKTTTIAKLAAAFAEAHSPRDVALVTTDTVRVGGREQLHSYGRQLGIAVYEADSDLKLAQVLERLADYKLVLIDTAGLGQRDKNLVGQLNWLRAAGQIHTLLVLPANSHFADLDEVVRRFSAVRPKGVVLTKVDETGRLGSPLSVIVDHQLPMAWITDGQRVPEDLHRANAANLVLRLDQLRREADEAIPAENIHVA